MIYASCKYAIGSCGSKKQLRLLAAEQNTTIQALLAEALNDFFAKNGKPEIAPLDKKD